MRQDLVDAYMLDDDGVFPNAAVPLLVYRTVVPADADEIERRFAMNRWTAAWRNGIYPYHHYHSTTHEVLGCYAGEATIRFGGDSVGIELRFAAGDVVVIPAGVAHKRIRSVAGFGVVGAYPDGRSWDMNYGKPEERKAALEAIRSVPIPALDPVSGEGGPLRRRWHAATAAPGGI